MSQLSRMTVQLYPCCHHKVVNLNHMKEFQECMNTYEVGNGVRSFNMIACIHAAITKL